MPGTWTITQAAAILMLIASIEAKASETDFHKFCEIALPQAYSFSERCKSEAKPFSRTFYPGAVVAGEGQPESYSALLDLSLGSKSSFGSNFILGCVLDFRKKLNYVGLYYGGSLSFQDRQSKYAVVFIDPNDNIGIEIAGKRHTLIAVRQFVSATIPARLEGRPKNCEKSSLGAESFGSVGPNTMKHCVGGMGENFCEEKDYDTSDSRALSSAPILFNDFTSYFINENGQLAISRDWLKNVCTAWKGDPFSAESIVYESCHPTK